MNEDIIKQAEQEHDTYLRSRAKQNGSNGSQKPNDGETEQGGKKTVASKLVELALSKNIDLYLDQFNEPRVTFLDKPVVGFPVKSTTFKRWLSSLYWETAKKGFSGDIFSQVVNILEGKTTYEGRKEQMYNRIAKVGSEIYVDLGNDREIVKITPKGWEIIKESPVKFQRFNHQQVQVIPLHGGDLKQVEKYVNLKTKTDYLLFLTYLITVYIPNIPRVILIGIGDQGAAKSTAFRVVRSLVDPSISELLSPPRDINELAQASNHHYCLYLDNLSYLKDEMSDILSRLATGIGFTKRKLFTDNEDIVFDQKSVVGITGISLVATKADLLDRCLILSFERIPEDDRVDEGELWEKFNKEKPYILGALFTTLSKVLATFDNFKLPRKPRMADYAKYAAVAAIVLGETADKFLTAFDKNINRQNQAAIESSPTAQVILKFMSDKDNWEGTSAMLFGLLKAIAESENLMIGGTEGFPKASNWLWKKILLVRPNILSMGFQINKGEVASGSIITITKKLQESKNTTTAASASKESDEYMATMAVSQPSLDIDPYKNIPEYWNTIPKDQWPEWKLNQDQNEFQKQEDLDGR